MHLVPVLFRWSYARKDCNAEVASHTTRGSVGLNSLIL